ncbi:axoneme-associated protein mst101(2) [Drosophila bipectinata]|uniref:axoneme-associated protein mst101(2) n=1 Tax=Drosophila bipectinata TaxID=42026 RepID=UPI0038B28F82
MLRRCIGRQMQCLLAFPRPTPLIQAASSCQRYTSRASFFGPSFLRGQIKWIEKDRPTLGALQFDPPMSCDILYTDVNQPGPSFVSKQVRQVQERICLVGQVRGLSDKGPPGPKNISVCLLSRKGKLYHKESKRDTMETCMDKRKNCLCNKWRPRPRPKKHETHKNVSKRLEELMQNGPECSIERKNLNETVSKKGHEERPSRAHTDDSDLYFDCEEPKFTLNNFISMLREKSNEIVEQLREGKVADQQRLQQVENDVTSKYKDMYEQNSSVTRPRRIKDESLINPSPRSVEDLRTYESQEEPRPNIKRPKLQRFETRKQLELDRLVDYVREKNREAMNNSEGCENLIKAQFQAQELDSDQSSKSDCSEVINKENKHPYKYNYQVKYQRYWPKSDTATADKIQCYDNDPPQTPNCEVDSSNSGKQKIDIAEFNGKLERCEKLQIQIADLVGKCISLVLGKLEKEEKGPKNREEDHSAVQSTDAVAVTKCSDKIIDGKEKLSIIKSPERSSSYTRTQAKLYSSQKINKPPSQYLALQVDNIIRQCEALKSEFERRSHSTFSKSPGPNAGSREVLRKRSPVEMEMKRRCALEAMRKKCKGALEDSNFIEEENEEVRVLRKKEAELKRKYEKAKLKEQCELLRKKIKESEDKGVSERKFWREALQKINAKEYQRKKMVEGFLRDKIRKLKSSERSVSPKQKEPTPLGFTQNTTIKIKEKQDSATKKKCAEKELKKKCAEEELKKKCAEKDLKKKFAEEELKKKCAEVELKKKCAEKELKKKCGEVALKKKCAEEELKKKCAEEELKKKCAGEELKKQCTEEDLKKKRFKEKNMKKLTDEELKKKCAADEEERKKVETQLTLKCFEAKLKKKCEEIDKRKQISNQHEADELRKKNIEASLKKKCPKEEPEKLKPEGAKEEKKKMAEKFEENEAKLSEEEKKKKGSEKEFKIKCIQAALKHKSAEKELKNKRGKEELTKKCAEREKKEECAKEELKNKCDDEEKKKRAEKEFKLKCIQAAIKYKEEFKKNCAEEEQEEYKKFSKEELRKGSIEETHMEKYKVPEQKPTTAALGIRNKDNDFPEIYKESQMQEKRLMGELRRWWEEVDRNTKNVGGVALSQHESEEIKSWLKRQKEKDAQAGKAQPKCAGPKENNMVKFQSLDGIFQTSGLTSEAHSCRGLLDALCDPLPRLRRRVLRKPLIGFPPLIENILCPGYCHGIIQSPERCRIPLLGPNIFLRQILPRLKPLSINGNLRVYWLDGIFPSTTFSRRGHTKNESARYSSLGWPYATLGRESSDDESQD